ncbi:hypothetical protein MMC17_004175 [Xylographa soralifera]|nr:hypothetical protein [Xylographa soralifera]
MIDFTLSPSQRTVLTTASNFASTVLVSASSTYSVPSTQRARFLALRPFYRLAVQHGLLRAQMPPSLGGTGGSLLDAALLVEVLYAADTSVSLTIFSTGLGLSPLLMAGTEEQKEEFLKPFLSGEGEPLASLVQSEPGGTANWLEKGGKGLGTTARREGDEWVLSGEKTWATNSAGWDDRGADLQCVVCRQAQAGEAQDPERDPKQDILVLLVTSQTVADNPPEAYQVLAHLETPGHTAVSGPHVRFTNFRVPAKNLLAEPGKGVEAVAQAFTASAVLVGAMSVGIMRAAFEAALKFAKDDTRGGAKPILERQSVADLLIGVKMRADASRLLTWKACQALEGGLGAEQAIEAKIFCSDNAVKCVVDAMSAVGMSSYSSASPFPKLMNDALCLPLFSGGNVGVKRRQLERLFLADDYQPWASTYQ